MRGDIALFLGLVAVIGGGITVAVVFIFGEGDGDGGGNILCDERPVPRGEGDISQIGFQAWDVGLTTVIEAASAGDLEAAEEAFFGDLQDSTHEVDPAIREVDEELAKELCEAVIDIEGELALERRADRVALQAMRIRELLRDAAEALGYARPGG